MAKSKPNVNSLNLYPQLRGKVAEFNRKQASQILKLAGIGSKNPDYKQYLALTMANVNNAGRLGGYNEFVRNMFVDTLKNPDLTLAQYKEASQKFVTDFAEEQFVMANGLVQNENPNFSYAEHRKIINDTLLSGTIMRNRNSVKFPDVFYDDKGKLRPRLEVKLPKAYIKESAMGMINGFVEQYSDILFDTTGNHFVVKGQKVGPERFFNSKIDALDKLKMESVDFADDELMQIIKSADYNQFVQLRKERGLSNNHMNIILRNALADEVVFNEVCTKLKGSAVSKFGLQKAIVEVKADFVKNAEIIRTESEKDVLANIDTVILSVVPYDIATMATFRNWKSCMHAIGGYHASVAENIALGSIVAYGYDSVDPKNMVSRLLINPYVSEDNNEVVYFTNDRMYGKENLAFRLAVDDIVSACFNKDKPDGLYVLNKFLYNDDDCGGICAIYNPQNGKTFDLKKYVKDNIVYFPDTISDLSGLDLRGYNEIYFPRNISGLKNTKLSGYVDLLRCQKISIKGADFSNCISVILPACVTDLAKVKLSRFLDMEKCVSLDMKSADFSKCVHIKLPRNIKSLDGLMLPLSIDLSACEKLDCKKVDFSVFEEVIFPKNIADLDGIKLPKKLNLAKCEKLNSDGADFSGCDSVVFPDNVKNLHNIKFPRVADFEHCDNFDFTGADFSECENVKFPFDIKSLEGVKLPKNINLYACRFLDIKNTDFSGCDNVKFPWRISSLVGTKLPKVVDLDSCSEVNFKGADFSNCSEVHFPKSVNSLKGCKLPKKIDLSKSYVLEIDWADFSNCDSVKMAPNVRSLEKVKLPKKLDLSACEYIDLRSCDLDKTEELILPKNYDASLLPEGIVERNPVVAKALKTANAGFNKKPTSTIDLSLIKQSKTHLK